jgi:glutamate N-acetyltransferase / amino-acid N-acetyltransferase
MRAMSPHGPRSTVAPADASPRETLDTFDFAPGFRALASACGLKEGGALDLAIVLAERPCAAAGVFTTNRVKAAPVLYDAEILARDPSQIRAVVANAGCANACTGEPGLSDTRDTAAAIAARVGCRADQVLVLSTGVIGRRLDMEKLSRGIEVAFVDPASPGAARAARAILTTDTRPKVAAIDVEIGARRIAIRGFAKGAGMIHPDMATMLAVVTTDARVEPALLARALRSANARSFNRISVDGDMSTNDTVLVLASGASDVVVDEARLPAFEEALAAACGSLARQIARDGEGATRLVEIRVSGAATEHDAHVVADAIGRSLLVKTAIHGGDPNWGRVLAAAGSCGVAIDPDRVTLAFGAAGDEARVVEQGLPTNLPLDRAAAKLADDPVLVRLDLGLGAGAAVVWTCDLSAEYVAINAHYTT